MVAIRRHRSLAISTCLITPTAFKTTSGWATSIAAASRKSCKTSAFRISPAPPRAKRAVGGSGGQGTRAVSKTKRQPCPPEPLHRFVPHSRLQHLNARARRYFSDTRSDVMFHIQLTPVAASDRQWCNHGKRFGAIGKLARNGPLSSSGHLFKRSVKYRHGHLINLHFGGGGGSGWRGWWQWRVGSCVAISGQMWNLNPMRPSDRRDPLVSCTLPKEMLALARNCLSAVVFYGGDRRMRSSGSQRI